MTCGFQATSYYQIGVRGVDHCCSHCRGLMYRGKYSAVIGRKMRFLVCAEYQFPGHGNSIANHSAVHGRKTRFLVCARN